MPCHIRSKVCSRVNFLSSASVKICKNQLTNQIEGRGIFQPANKKKQTMENDLKVLYHPNTIYSLFKGETPSKNFLCYNDIYKRNSNLKKNLEERKKFIIKPRVRAVAIFFRFIVFSILNKRLASLVYCRQSIRGSRTLTVFKLGRFSEGRVFYRKT